MHRLATLALLALLPLAACSSTRATTEVLMKPGDRIDVTLRGEDASIRNRGPADLRVEPLAPSGDAVTLSSGQIHPVELDEEDRASLIIEAPADEGTRASITIRSGDRSHYTGAGYTMVADRLLADMEPRMPGMFAPTDLELAGILQ